MFLQPNSTSCTGIPCGSLARGNSLCSKGTIIPLPQGKLLPVQWVNCWCRSALFHVAKLGLRRGPVHKSPPKIDLPTPALSTPSPCPIIPLPATPCPCTAQHNTYPRDGHHSLHWSSWEGSGLHTSTANWHTIAQHFTALLHWLVLMEYAFHRHRRGEDLSH